MVDDVQGAATPANRRPLLGRNFAAQAFMVACDVDEPASYCWCRTQRRCLLFTTPALPPCKNSSTSAHKTHSSLNSARPATVGFSHLPSNLESTPHELRILLLGVAQQPPLIRVADYSPGEKATGGAMDALAKVPPNEGRPRVHGDQQELDMQHCSRQAEGISIERCDKRIPLVPRPTSYEVC